MVVPVTRVTLTAGFRCPARRAPAAALTLLLALGAATSLNAAQVPQPATHDATNTAEPAAEAEHEGWLPTVAKIVNFGVLVGTLVYFLKAPIVLHLSTRRQTIRQELEDAKTLRASAQQSLDGVRARLAELPGELDALRARGRDELADEAVRMKAATSQQRTALQEATAREIALQLRIARRVLLEHAADRAMALAQARIARSITPADQAHLIEAYMTEVQP